MFIKGIFVFTKIIGGIFMNEVLFQKINMGNENQSLGGLSPDILRVTIDNLGISIRAASKEIGVAHTTLSRYLRGEIKHHNKNNDEKMLNWLHNVYFKK
ncbi:hypothetical protein DZB84_20795 [Bacillus sp. HNG]|nr:hypothetical protein DZB84_20795 [Bacillus sp. HNG]